MAPQFSALYNYDDNVLRFARLMTGTPFAPSPRCNDSEVMSERNEDNRLNYRDHTMRKNKRIVLERILFPTDLSTETTDGLEYAAALARSYGARLFVAHCVGPQAEYGASEEAERLLTELSAKQVHPDVATPTIICGLAVEGEPAKAVALLAAEQHIDLIVMSPSRTPWVATLLDSTAEAISRTAPCPVLITHKEMRDRARVSATGIDFKRILVAYDFSGDSELALTHGISIAQEFQSELHLIHVLAPNPKTSSPGLAIAPANFENAFQIAARRLSNAAPAETHLWSEVKQVVSQGSPYREILAYAGENNIDLRCVGASGAGFGLWALFGSNADRILRQAACSVLIARPLRPIAGEAVVPGACRVAS